MSRMSVKVADEVWVATALLHREQPGKEGFSASEIVERAARERMTERLRPGVSVHAYQHCVANRAPNPGNMRMLYAMSNGNRRLFRSGDDYHPFREGGKQTPRPQDLPAQYGNLLDWYRTEYDRAPSLVQDRGANYVAAPASSVFENIRDIWSRVPEDEMLKLPSDGAAHHDQYVNRSR